MEPLLDLPIDQFFGALDELGLDPERRSDLLREYRRRNSAFSPVYGLLDSVADEDAAAGMQRADIVPISRPEGMSVFEAIRSGDWRFAVPQGALDAVGNVAGALDVPAAAAAGLIPREDMVGEALNAAGTVMGLGGLLARPAGSLGTGGRVAPRSGDETPAQQVARLLREGRSDEVTDGLMAQADPQEMYQLYVSGETGMDLPMDEASRMARAREMGFDQPAFHGGTSDIRAISQFEGSAEGGPGILFSSDEARVANTYAPRRPQPMGENVTPLMLRSGDYRQAGYTREFPANGTQAEINDWISGLDAFNARMARFGVKPSVFNQQIEAARAANQPGVVFRQVVDDRVDTGMSLPSDVFATVDPTSARSRFARFDPRLSHLANLNAANIDPLTGAAAMGASQQQQDPLASLRAYLAQNGLLSQ